MYVSRWNDGVEVGHVDADGTWHTDSHPGEPRDPLQQVHDLNRADRTAGRVTGVAEISIESSEGGFYTLGWYSPDGRWHPMFDVETRDLGEPWRLWLTGHDVPEPSA